MSRWSRRRSEPPARWFTPPDRLQERFLLLNGDSFFDFNVLDLVARANASLVHMALRADVIGDRYGRVVLDGDRVRSFIAPGQGATGPVNAGVYVRRPLASLDRGSAASPLLSSRTYSLRWPPPAP